MQAPPPPMMSGPMMMDRKKMVIALAIGLGIFFLAIGAIIVDWSHNVGFNETPEQTLARNNLGNAWGPAIGHFGMFLFVGGLIGAAIMMDEGDPFVRLFLLVLAFVALLLILARSPTIFG